MRRALNFVMAGMLLAIGPLGCASSRTTTVRTEGQVQYPGTVVGTETTTTTVTQPPRESRGILSTTINFLGEVISWPFRLVGALFRALF